MPIDTILFNEEEISEAQNTWAEQGLKDGDVDQDFGNSLPKIIVIVGSA